MNTNKTRFSRIPSNADVAEDGEKDMSTILLVAF